MEQNFNTLTILAEVNIGFVAFTAIVASLRVTLGKKLTPFQSLLVHFFTETGLLNISIALLPLVLWGFLRDEIATTFYSTLYAFLSATTYLVFYIRRRLRIAAPTPLPSLVVMIGYGVWITVLVDNTFRAFLGTFAGHHRGGLLLGSYQRWGYFC